MLALRNGRCLDGLCFMSRSSHQQTVTEFKKTGQEVGLARITLQVPQSMEMKIADGNQ